ncbi:MAG: biotin/lipoyl-binding protein [Candidatus Rokubacteria bacterium]|nr:biotin/lipoyl-binding protein [Candidatus Rokubacteria bacterium]
MNFVLTSGSRTHRVTVTQENGRYRVTVDDHAWDVDARLTAQGIFSLLIDGVSHVADVDDHAGVCVVDVGGETYSIEVEEQTRYIIRTRGGAAGGAGGQTVKAPLPGKITYVSVRAGDAVAAGQSLVVIEAMKMENELKATAAGTVREVRVAAGQAVNAGDVLVVIG